MLSIDSIEPTVFFINDSDGYLQLVNVTINNQSDLKKAILEIKLNNLKQFLVDKLEQGKAKYSFFVPDIREKLKAEFILKTDEKIFDKKIIDWQPRKHWEIYMVPIAHHDLGYTDTIEGVLRKYCMIYEDVLRFCEETEDYPEEAKFRYMVEESWSIQHFINVSSKETREKLAKYIKQGRIEIPAFFGNEITGLCGHEELIRLMYPSFRIHREYGAPIKVGSITDIPGLSWGIPTVLSGAGVKYFFAGLPTYFQWGRSDIHTFWDEDTILRSHGRPDAFYWKGPDGGEILVFYQGSYGCWSPYSYQEIMDQLPAMLNDMDRRGCPFSVMRYGGYGCGDNTGTDIIVSNIVKEWNSKWAYPKLIVATNSMFFEKLEKQCDGIRTFRGELPHTDYAVGAMSTALETTINRVTHDMFNSAEKLATIATLIGHYPYPADSIRDAYDNMLLYDEHTWGKAYQVGKVQDWAWNEKSRYSYKAAGLADTILSMSVDRISELIGLEDENKYITVFNPLSYQRTDLVTLNKIDFNETFDLIDTETGNSIPYQIIELDSPQSPVPHSAGRYARGQFDHSELLGIAFIAENVPPLGYKTYKILPKEEKTNFNSDLVVSETSLENKYFIVKLNPQTGTIQSIYDKQLCKELVDTSAPHQVNQLIVRWVKTGDQESPNKATIRKSKNGPVSASLVVSSNAPGCPQLTQEIILYNDIKRIDLANRILKDSTPAMEVYFAFPFKMDTPEFMFEGSNSVIKPLRDQFPGSNSNYYSVQHWADVSDGKTGITLTPIDAHLLEFGGLWQCYVSQAHHGVTPPDFGVPFVTEMNKGYMYSFVIDSNFRTNFQATQCGDILFRYSLTTHNGDWKDGKPRDFGWAICNPLIPVMLDGKRDGNLPKSMSFCQLDKPNVLVTTLKIAEDNEGFIIRLTETEGIETDVTVTLPFVNIGKVFQTNLVEHNERQIPFSNQKINVSIKPFGIATIRIQ